MGCTTCFVITRPTTPRLTRESQSGAGGSHADRAASLARHHHDVLGSRKPPAQGRSKKKGARDLMGHDLDPETAPFGEWMERLHRGLLAYNIRPSDATGHTFQQSPLCTHPRWPAQP